MSVEAEGAKAPDVEFVLAGETFVWKEPVLRLGRRYFTEMLEIANNFGLEKLLNQAGEVKADDIGNLVTLMKFSAAALEWMGKNALPKGTDKTRIMDNATDSEILSAFIKIFGSISHPFVLMKNSIKNDMEQPKAEEGREPLNG